MRPALLNSMAAYSDGNLVVLGPKGWNCFGWSGPSGSGLEVVPPSMQRRPVNYRGEAIVVQRWFGGTSGRSGVAKVGAPLFPWVAAAVEHRRKAGDLSVRDAFRAVPWTGEEVFRPEESREAFRPERNELWFMDGPDTEGSGTVSTGLAPSKLPIGGAVRLVPRAPGDSRHELPDLTLIAVRLGPDRNALVSEIISDWRLRR